MYEWSVLYEKSNEKKAGIAFIISDLVDFNP